MRVRILFVIGLLLAQITSGIEYFQKRAIFIDNDDVCHEGSAMNDIIRFKINVDGLETRTKYAWGFTTCRENVISRGSINVSWPKRWILYDFDTDTTTIEFNEEL